MANRKTEQTAAFQAFMGRTLEPVVLPDEDDDGAEAALVAQPKTRAPNAGAVAVA